MEDYKGMIGKIYSYFEQDKYYEITEVGRDYIKMLQNSTYGSWNLIIESKNEERSNKIKRILDNVE